MFLGTGFEAIVNDSLEGSGGDVLFVVVDFVQNVEGNDSLRFGEQLVNDKEATENLPVTQ
jgi:hypothetical protein